MKKISKKLISIAITASLLLPAIILAQEAAPSQCTIRRATGITDCPGVGAVSIYDQVYGTVRGAVCCLMSTIYYVTDWAFVILIAISVITAIFGGFKFVTAAGSPEEAEKGRNYIKYALIGVLIALAAKAVPPLVKVIMGI